MIIELPEWRNWRIEGSDNDWEIQTYEPKSGKDGGPRWRGTNFFNSLGHAVCFAYEKTLRKSAKRAQTIDEAMAECERVKDELVKAVEKALAGAAS